MNVYQICLLIWMAIYVVIFVYERLTGRALFAKIRQVKPIMDALRTMSIAINGVSPSAPVEQLEKILTAAVEATTQAENLWRSGSLPKTERAPYCEAILTETLKEAGIEVTQQVHEVTRGAIALTCMMLPHEADYPLPEAQEEET